MGQFYWGEDMYVYKLACMLFMNDLRWEGGRVVCSRGRCEFRKGGGCS